MIEFKRLLSKDGLPLTFTVFYCVGLLLYFPVYTRQWFILMVPYTLLLTAFAVLFYHVGWNRNSLIALLFIFLSSVLVEILGVKTGKLFGVYWYNESLGLKVADVPVIIGLNWVILVYGSRAILSKIVTNRSLKILGASALMVVYDAILEKAAPILKMWEFEGGNPPYRNYFMWFILAVIFNFILDMLKVNTENKPARALFSIQIAFFLVIVVYNFVFIA